MKYSFEESPSKKAKEAKESHSKKAREAKESPSKKARESKDSDLTKLTVNWSHLVRVLNYI